MKKLLALKAIQSVCLLALVVANASMIGIGVASAQSTTTITFDESVSLANPGFNGKANPFLISTDGQFRVEAFAANNLPFAFNGAAFHFSQFFPCTLQEWGRLEANPNQSTLPSPNAHPAGLRITSVDGNPLTLVSMRLFGQVSIGQLDDVTTGAGNWTLFTRSSTAGETETFGSQFSDVTEIFFIDAFLAGGTTRSNCWDDIVLRQVIKIDIDIKPGSDPNCFDVNGHGVIPVAILGNSTFDVTLVDVSTLSFGGLEVRVRGNKGPSCSFEDSNGDTILDLACHFEDDSANWAPGDGDATLTGTLLDGTTFEGTDSICVVP